MDPNTENQMMRVDGYENLEWIQKRNKEGKNQN